MPHTHFGLISLIQKGFFQASLRGIAIIININQEKRGLIN